MYSEAAYSVVGIGYAIMDFVAHVPAAEVLRSGARPGTMQLVDHGRSRALRRPLTPARILPGGSCANTMRGLGWLRAALGGDLEPPLFVGVGGRDEEGRAYARALRCGGVATALQRRSGATATSTVLVTPDGERTMFTCLAVSPRFEPPLMPAEVWTAARACYATGFLCDVATSLDALSRCAAAAVRRKVPVVFDLADPLVVERHRRLLCDWMPGTVTVLIGNREELHVLTRCNDDGSALAAAGEMASIVVMKVGAAGALVWEPGSVQAVATVAVAAVDTTGAGDAFAAGFLFRWLAGSLPAAAAAMGNLLAGAVVAVEGCDYARLDSAVVSTGRATAAGVGAGRPVPAPGQAAPGRGHGRSGR